MTENSKAKNKTCISNKVSEIKKEASRTVKLEGIVLCRKNDKTTGKKKIKHTRTHH